MSGASNARGEHTPWCCDGFAALCPLCRDRPTSTLRCPGHAYSDRNRENVRTSRLHASFQHPDYEYRVTEGPRKQWDSVDLPPCDETGTPEAGWERNRDAGRNGWERFDYTEESYWRRRKQAHPEGLFVRQEDIAAHMLHLPKPEFLVSLCEDDGTLIVGIRPDGSIATGPNYRPDAAAREFWDAITRAAQAASPIPITSKEQA